MTFGSLWGSPTRSKIQNDDYNNRLSLYHNERGDTGGYSYGGSTKSKKAEKKQAAMSALTLIAFLFFLNILQNCLKDQMEEKESMTIMMLPVNQAQAREPDEELPVAKEEVVSSRKLLSINEEPEPTRQSKFIHDFGLGSRDWTNELSQITDEDLVSQKEKVDQLRQVWDGKEAKKRKPSLEAEVEKVKIKKFINNPVLSDLKTIPKLSNYWANQKTTTEETKYVEFENPDKKVADFHEFEPLTEDKPLENYIHNTATSLRLQAPKPEELDPRKEFQQTQRSILPELVSGFHPITGVGVIEQVSNPYNTPRSDELLTTLPNEDLFFPEDNQVTDIPATAIPTTTPKTYHVYTHPSQIFSTVWPSTLTTTTTTTEEVPTTGTLNINEIYLTTLRPMPGKPHRRHPANHRPQYRPAVRYEYSPYRRVGYEPPLIRQAYNPAPMVRHEYYPMSVVGQYGGNQQAPAMGVLQLIWTLVSSFARPIARLVPNASKVGTEAQCWDLLACEAHRAGQVMGPTAQALASSFSSFLTWVTPETERSLLKNAIASASDNSCLQQIQSCDERTGGKSTMTVLAKLLEIRPDREARLPKKS